MHLKPTYFAVMSAPMRSRNSKRHAGPFADVVPALDADVARALRHLGQGVDVAQAQGRLSPIRPASSSFQVAGSTSFTMSRP